MGTRIWFDPPMFRWSRVLAVAAVGVVAIVGWLGQERGLWGGQGEATAVAIAPAASGATARSAASAASGGARRVVSAAATPPRESSPGKTSEQAPGPRDLEVCGRGVVRAKPGASEEEVEEQASKLTASSARDHWLAAMLAKGDTKTRAAALLLSNKEFDKPSVTEQLVRLAQDSRDSTVYGWALYGCHGRNDVRPPNSCLMLSYDDWAALVPNQAIPWLYVASDEAKPRRIDPAEAMYRAARADTLGSTFGVLPGVVLAAQPTDASQMDRYAMLMEAIAVSAAINSRTPYPSRHCNRSSLGDANRRQQCEVLAQMLASKADSLLDLTVAKGMGGRLGWSDERLKAISDEERALQMALIEQTDSHQPLSCASIDRLAAYTGEVARLGEVGAARALARRSGTSLQDLAVKFDQRLSQASAQLSAASAPASGP